MDEQTPESPPSTAPVVPPARAPSRASQAKQTQMTEIAGAWHPAAVEPYSDRRKGVPRWIAIPLVAMLAFCGLCGGLVYFLVYPELRKLVVNSEGAVSDDIATTITVAVSRRIESGLSPNGELTIWASDLDINNGEGPPNKVGFKKGSHGTLIFGFVTVIGHSRIAILIGEKRAYSATPVVQGGRVEMTEIQVVNSVYEFALQKPGFEHAMENGINRALRDHGLTPTSLVVGDHKMTIQTRPANPG